MKQNLKCFISAGELSGDLLGASLVSSLLQIYPKIDFFGLTGKNLESVGVRSIASMDEINVMGLLEVLKQLPTLIDVESRILTEIERQQPDFIILIDFPGFHFKLAEQLKQQGLKIFQYIAPKVWAWGEKRNLNLARDFEEVLGIFPFEADYFREKNVPYHYIGNPLKDRVNAIQSKRSDFNIDENKKIIACLPGSRINEVKKIMPIINSLQKKLAHEQFEFVIPVAKNLNFSDILKFLPEELKSDLDLKHISNQDYLSIPGFKLLRGQSLELMKIADFAVVTSGTATLECALLLTPMVVVYAMNPISYKLAKKKVKIPWISLVNILAQKELVKEFVQEFTEEDVITEIMSLLNDSDKYEKMKNSFVELYNSLHENASDQAAFRILTKVGAI